MHLIFLLFFFSQSQARIAAGVPTSLDESEMAPIWNPNEIQCSQCFKPFSFFVRKHHCRNWCVFSVSIFVFLLHSNTFFLLYSGICVCEMCSKEKVRIPKLDERTLYKVCNHCSKVLKESRVYGFQSDLTP
jgi:hypothetical protein